MLLFATRSDALPRGKNITWEITCGGLGGFAPEVAFRRAKAITEIARIAALQCRRSVPRTSEHHPPTPSDTARADGSARSARLAVRLARLVSMPVGRRRSWSSEYWKPASFPLGRPPSV